VWTQRRVLLDRVMPASPDGAAVAFEVTKDQLVRVAGTSTAVFVAFNRHNLKERFDQARTRNNQRCLYPTRGSWLFTKDNTIMLAIVEDTWGWHHDLQTGLCTRKTLELLFRRAGPPDSRGDGSVPYAMTWGRWEDIPARGCRENLAEALAPWEIPPWEIPSPFNIFQNLGIDGETGRMWFDHPEPARESVVTMRAEMDLVVAVGQHWGTTTGLQLLEGWPPPTVAGGEGSAARGAAAPRRPPVGSPRAG